jgi:hypothetical protein
MIIYHPYKKVIDRKKILLQIIIINYIFVMLEHLILLYIKMKQENKDINRHKNESKI